MRVHGLDAQTRYARSSDETREVSRGSGAAIRASETRALGGMRASESPDMAKVERLRAAIARGEFKVNLEAIASRMMEEER